MRQAVEGVEVKKRCSLHQLWSSLLWLLLSCYCKNLLNNTAPVRTANTKLWGVMGAATDIERGAIGGVNVSVGDRTVMANDEGWSNVDNVPASDRALVTFSKTGYVSTQKVGMSSFARGAGGWQDNRV